MPTRRGNLQHSNNSRVWVIEDGAGPSHVPSYQTRARATGVTWNQGDITPIRIPDPKQYGRFITVDTIRGQAALPTSSLEFRGAMSMSEMLLLTRKGCNFDVQLHIGRCKDPSDFELGWEKISVFEGVSISSYANSDLGALDQDQEAIVMETVSITAQDYYELRQLTFGAQAETQIVQEVIDIAICDSKVCGDCGIPSDGCQRVFAIQTPVGASPGVTSELVYTTDGGATWSETNVSSLPANRVASSLACVGPYLVVFSNTDDSLHYAKISDILAGTATWTRVATGIVASGSPNAVVSLGRTQTWVAGDGGYIYTSADITSGLTPQTSGDVTAQNLNAISALDEDHLLAGGAANAILFTSNGGVTWSAATGPSGQAAVAVTAVAMRGELEWIVGYGDGKVFYTIDGGINWVQKNLPSQSALTVIDDIQFSTPTVGYLAAHTATAARLMRTINGGQSWTVMPEGAGLMPTASEFNAIAACGEDPNLIWAGGVKTTAGDGILVKGA